MNTAEKADSLWKNPADGKDLIEAVDHALPGFGAQKARIFAALLGKQLGVQPEGWRAATKPFGDENTFFSIADITDAESLGQVRAHKQAMKAKAKVTATATATAKGPVKAKAKGPTKA